MHYPRLFCTLIVSLSLTLPLSAHAVGGDKDIKIRGLANKICGVYNVSGDNVARDSRGMIVIYFKKYKFSFYVRI